MGRYAEVFQQSLAYPEGFWAEAASDIEWYRAPRVVLDASDPPFYRWFADGVLNTCFNALDRHVRDGRGGQAALIYDSPVTGVQRTCSYDELLAEVARFAGLLRSLDVGRGDRVIIYMPMIPEALIAMLACARIGAVHSVVFGGFAAAELATRIDDAAPKAMVSASCGIEPGRIVEYKPILDRAITLARHKPGRCVIVQRPQATAALTAGRDLDWDQAVAGAETVAPPVMMQELDLHPRHVDAGRAFALAALARDAQLHRLAHACGDERFGAELTRKSQPQGVGAAAGQVLLVAGGAVGGAHVPHRPVSRLLRSRHQRPFGCGPAGRLPLRPPGCRDRGAFEQNAPVFDR